MNQNHTEPRPWHLGRMCGFDLETTGVDVENDRIVTACVVQCGGGPPPAPAKWVADPGIEIPEAAAKVHGYTTDRARKEGRPAGEVVEEIVTALTAVVLSGIPVVAMNAPYDFTLLDREARRHLGDSLEGICRHPIDRVIDTMLLDKQVAPFRRRVSETQGPYQMRTTAETYGLGWNEEQAHGAAYDALMSARAAYKMGAIAHRPRSERPVWVHRLRTQRFDSLAGVSVEDLHQMQIRWSLENAASFQEYLRTKAPEGKRDPDAVIDGRWPLRPVGGEQS